MTTYKAHFKKYKILKNMLQNFLKIKNRTLFWNTIEKILISKNQNNLTKITISTTDGNLMTYQDKGQSTDIADYVVTLISDNFDTDNNRISQNGKFLKIKNEIWNLEFLKEARQRVKKGGNKELYLHFKNSTRIIKDEVEDILDLLPQLQSLTTVENNLVNKQDVLGSGAISGGGIAQNYSTSEIALLNSNGTALLWIDGKQVYQRTISGEVTSSQFLSFGLLGIDTLINCFGMAKNTSINSPDFNLSFVGVNKTSVQIQANSSPLGLYNITVEYTKL